MISKKIILLFLLAAIALGSGFIFHKTSLKGVPTETNLLYAIELQDLSKKKLTLQNYKNKLLIINFWATWCAPCREEIPELNEFYKNKDINLIAIAIDEIADVIKFQDEIPIQYPSFIANELEGVTLAKKLGNERGVLPFTVIIQPDGSVKKSFYGKVKISDLNQALSDNSF